MSVNKIGQLTIGETAKVEELSGQNIASLQDENAPKAKVLAALAFVFKKREDPAFKWNDALEMTFDEISELLNLSGDEGEDDGDPLAPSVKQPGKKAPAKKTNAKK